MSQQTPFFLYSPPNEKKPHAHAGRVAIITRTKNREILLRRALQSVLGQTYKNWHLVVVNDGGEAKSVENLISSFDFGGQLTLIHHPQSLGMEKASNVGIESSESEFIVIHDDDDAWHPEFLSNCIEFLRAPENQVYGGVITHSRRVWESMGQNQVQILSQEDFNSHLKSVELSRMVKNNLFPPISFVFRREVMEEVGPFNSGLPVLGDWEFNLRFLMKSEIGVLAKPLAYYHYRRTAGDYGNTVTAGEAMHEKYAALIRNGMLRAALKERPETLGFLLNSQLPPMESFSQVQSQVDFLYRVLNWPLRPLRRVLRLLKRK